MTANTSCPSCGTPIATNDRFCGGCGADLTRLSAPAPAPKPPASFNKTMLGLALPKDAFKPAAPDQAGTAPLPTPAPTPAARPIAQHTMLGMAVNDPALKAAVAEAQKAARAEAEPRAAAPKQRTMLGVPPVTGSDPAAGQPEPQGPAANARKLPAQSDRTMLGINVALPQNAGSGEFANADTVEQSADEVAEARAVSRKRSFTPVNTTGLSGSLPPVAVQSSAMRIVWLLVGALSVLAVGGGVLAWLSSRAPSLRVRVVTEVGTEQLEVEAPGATAGAKLRFLGVEQPLKAGVARFPLKADALTIGDNRLAIDLLRADGKVESSHVELKVAYRVRLETGKLAASNPEVEVVVDAVPGSKVLLDNTTLTLNEHGHGVRPYPVAGQAGGELAFTARYHVEPPGERAEDGKVELTLPVASMQIDRPGPEVITDQVELEIAGAVEPGAAVDIDGVTVDVNDGRFLYRLKLPEPGSRRLTVIARAKGKAPRVAEINVQRVADLTLAAASFTPDPSLTYARIAQKPVIYRGQKAAFDGRVYNVEVDGGKSVLQMLVLDCPGQNRCPLWVEYPQATEATIDSWVRVLGVIAGEQQFRSKQGQVQTVPSMHAQYVLKLAKK
jgi:hypothetical protein